MISIVYISLEPILFPVLTETKVLDLNYLKLCLDNRIRKNLDFQNKDNNAHLFKILADESLKVTKGCF